MERLEMEHIIPDEIEEYLENRLPEEREFEIEEHIAFCQECTQKVRAAYAFTFAWNRWTAKAHGKAYQRAHILAALKKKEEGERGTTFEERLRKERLRQWRERWAGRAAAAVRVVLNVPGEVTRIITEGVEALVPQPRLVFAYSTRPLQARGTEILEVKDETKVIAKGGAEVSVSASKVEVRVRLLHRQAAPLVLLVPDAKGETPLVSEPKKEPGKDYSLARFENVSPGKYTLVFEPME